MKNWGVIVAFLIGYSVFGDAEESVHWYDRLHQKMNTELEIFSWYLDSSVCELCESNTATNIDEGFQNSLSTLFRDEVFDDEYRKSRLWIRNTMLYDFQQRRFDMSRHLRINIRFPKSLDRFNIIFGGDEESDDSQSNQLINGFSKKIAISYRFLTQNLIKGTTSTGVRSYKNLYSDVKLWIPIEREKWRYRLGQRFEYSSDEKFLEDTTLTIDHLLSKSDFLCWYVGRQKKELFYAVEYFGSFTYNKLSEYNQGYQVGGSVYGVTRPVHQIINYAIFNRYKQNFYKEWLFYEWENRLEWREEFHFKSGYITLFSVEIFFGD